MVKKRIVAFDIGDKRIGVAVSDPFGEYAMPCDTYFRVGNFIKDVEAIAKIASDKGAGIIVCGMPVNFDGSDSIQTEKTTRFIEALKKATALPIFLEDERFTTMQARETQIMGKVKRGERKKTIDSIAASYILEGFLQRQKKEERENEKNKQRRRYFMNKNLRGEEEEFEEEDNIIILEDDEGNKEKYLHVGTIEYNKEWYCFFQKAEPETEEEEDEVVIFLLKGEGENQELVPLEDEALMDEVFAEFCKEYEEYENSEEAMKLDGAD